MYNNDVDTMIHGPIYIIIIISPWKNSIIIAFSPENLGLKYGGIMKQSNSLHKTRSHFHGHT